MKNLITILFVCLLQNTFAGTYYISNEGSTSNAGTSTSSTWTLAKANSFTFSAGDNILFKKGETFYGTITISNSGSSGNPITYGAYGTGANPVITGFTTVSSWTNLGSNIWESTSAVSTLSTCNMVIINGVNTAMGRYPNTGYLTYQSFSGNTSITSSSLTGTPNWTGAEVVIKKQHWIIDRNPITAQSGGTLTYTPSSSYNGQNNWGFFIQNDARTLDVQNEWYYNPSTKKFRIYSISLPSGVQVSSVDKLVAGDYINYLTFQNIDFTGANLSAFYLRSCAHVSINNCNISFSTNGVGGADLGSPSSYFDFENNTINHIQNNGLNLGDEFQNGTIKNNEIKNVGLITGMGNSDDGAYYAIFANGANNLIESNTLDTLGYIGIGFDGNNVTVNKNFVNYYDLIKDDGGGIYTSNASSGKVISNNIVINGIGTAAGSPYAGSQTNGIYLDNYASNVNVFNNSVANVGWAGYYLHNVKNITLRNNTAYNSGWMGLTVDNDLTSFTMSGVVIKGNLFIAQTSDERTARFNSKHNDLSTFGTVDSNYYARPVDDNSTINVIPNGDGGGEFNYDLAQWQTFSGQDAHSHTSPKSITSPDSLSFIYNATNSNVTNSLPYKYVDVDGTINDGTITLPAYSSAVLIQDGSSAGSIAAPTVSMSGSQNITVSSTSVYAVPSWAASHSGTVTWTKISGPGTTTFSASKSTSTGISGLQSGDYVFQCALLQDDGQTVTGTVSVHVSLPIPPSTQVPFIQFRIPTTFINK